MCLTRQPSYSTFTSNTQSDQCSAQKKKCERRQAEPGCVRCARLGRPCVLPDTNTSRRQRERLRRKEKWKLSREARARKDNGSEGSGSPGSGSVESQLHPSRVALTNLGKPAGTLAPVSSVACTPSLESTSLPATSMVFDGRTFGVVLPTDPRLVLQPPAMPLLRQSPARAPPVMPAKARSHLIFPCIAAYWNDYHPMVPMIHRTTFETAFVPGGFGHEIYGPWQPMALLYGMAAIGVRTVRGLGLSDSERLRCSRDFCEAAKHLLLSGYFGQTPTTTANHAATDIEVAQTIFMVIQVLLPIGMASKCGDLLRLGCQLLRKMCLAPSTLNDLKPEVDDDRIPTNALQWVRSELVVRLWVMFASLDSPFAYHSDREPLLEWFSDVKCRLPCHESFFDDPTPEVGMIRLVQQHMSSAGGQWKPPMVDTAKFLERRDAVVGRQLARQFVEPVFDHRAGLFAIAHFYSFLRYLRGLLKTYARLHAIETLPIMTQPPEQDLPAQSAYRARVELFEVLTVEYFKAMPEHVGFDLAMGDASKYFSCWPNYFAAKLHAQMVVNFTLCILNFDVEHFMQGDPGAADPELFQSAAFGKILESGITFVRLLESQMKEDPDMRSAHYLTATESFRIGGLNIAAVSLLRGECISNGMPADQVNKTIDASGFAYDLRVLLRHVEGIGKNFGIVAKRVAGNFKKAVEAAGVSASGPSVASGGGGADESDSEDVHLPSELGGGYRGSSAAGDLKTPSRTFASVVLTAERNTRSWVC